MNDKQSLTVRIDGERAARILEIADAESATTEEIVLEALDWYFQSKDWAIFDKEVQALIQENADLMRRLADS